MNGSHHAYEIPSLTLSESLSFMSGIKVSIICLNAYSWLGPALITRPPPAVTTLPFHVEPAAAEERAVLRHLLRLPQEVHSLDHLAIRRA